MLTSSKGWHLRGVLPRHLKCPETAVGLTLTTGRIAIVVVMISRNALKLSIAFSMLEFDGSKRGRKRDIGRRRNDRRDESIVMPIVFATACRSNLREQLANPSDCFNDGVTPQENTMSRLLVALAASVALAGTAFAQSANTNRQHAAANSQSETATKPNSVQQGPLMRNEIKQDLQKAAFTDIKILADAFVIEAKTKNGNPVVMNVGPGGFSAVEMLKHNSANANGTASSASPASGQNDHK